jgi:hypothetical protein
MGLDFKMKGDTIPEQDHIARFCRPMQIEDGKIQATAFMLRASEESLSVNWLEFLGCPNRESELDELQNIYPKYLDVGRSAKIAVLNVGEVHEKVLTESPDGRNLEFLHDPIAIDPSHSGIYGFRQDDELIAELILQTVSHTYPARKKLED